MDLEPITDVRSQEYLFMLDILTSSFPKEEYRDLPEIARLLKEEDAFRPTIIKAEDDAWCGIMNHWTLDGFIYVEHFAIREDLRSQGLGTEALEALSRAYNTPIVLEVEMPLSETERRRIAFYKRCGFKIINGRYFQPPYRSGDGPLEMLIMGCEATDRSFPTFEEIRKSIYKNVYLTSEDMPFPKEHIPTT